MISGIGKHRLSHGRFVRRPRSVPLNRRQELGSVGTGLPNIDAMGQGIPLNTKTTSFAKPTNLNLSAGILSDSHIEQLNIAREMFDNDSVAGAVVETLCGIPFGNFSLSGMPDKEHLKPYLAGMDRLRVKSLLPSIALTFLVDGAFLGNGIFDPKDKCFSAMIPHDMMFADIKPVPFFGATPVVDVRVTAEMAAVLRRDSNDPRMAAYLKHIPQEFLTRGVVALQPENTFFIPRRGRLDKPLGTSLFRKIMLVYILEKALFRGTLEIAYRRQRPVLHVLAGDDTWDPSAEDFETLSQYFVSADLDPVGAVVVTRNGVQVQEVGGPSDMWRWTDNVDVFTSIKLKGLGMPDGLLGGDLSLDSVSATLTVFINSMRAFRDYITRSVFYEKMFPYTSVVNEHRKDMAPSKFLEAANRAAAQGSVSCGNSWVVRASDSDVDMSDYLIPTIQWHSSLRPEGDKEYLELLDAMRQAGVPIPLRMIAAAGGQDIHDILNGAEDDVDIQARVAEYNKAIASVGGGGDQQTQEGGYGDEYAAFDAARLNHLKPKGLKNREFDDNLRPRTNINGHSYVTTARERKRMEEKADRVIAAASSNIAARMNHQLVGTDEEGRSGIIQRVRPDKPISGSPTFFRE